MPETNQECDMSGSARAIAAGFVIVAMTWSMFFDGFHVIPASIMAAAATLLAGQAMCRWRRAKHVVTKQVAP